MTILTSKKFWGNIFERAVKTFFEALSGMLIHGVAITDFDWLNILSVSATATFISVCINIVAGLKKNESEEE